MKIRKAQAADGPAIGKLQVASMKAGFKDIVPPELFPPMDAGAQGDKYAEYAMQADCLTYVAEGEDGRLQGFICAGPNRGREEEMDAELYALYVRPESTASGIGSALLAHLIKHIPETSGQTSWRSLIVWFFAANKPAEKCYLKTGAEPLPYKNPPQGYIPIPHKACGWFF